MLTQAQPATNPRLVKEADALSEAGHEVEVLCGRQAQWATAADRELLASRRWRCTYVGGAPGSAAYNWTRLRSRVARSTEAFVPALREAAAARIVPELAKAALQQRADLYIARHPGALSAAARAAEKYGARLGYDAEDFESGHGPLGDARLSARPSQQDRIAAALERHWLPRCDYVTAGSPAIADAYAEQYGIARPTPILNVFPLRDRPAELRASSDGPLRLYWFSQTIGGDRGLQDVVRAMAMNLPRDIELHLRGVWAAGFERELRELAQSLGVPGTRIVHHAPAAPDQMVRLAAEFDIGLALEQPVSRNRLLCLTNKIFTYVLAGNATVATLTPGQAPMIRECGEAIAGCEAGNIEQLAAALARWHDDRSALARARETAWVLGGERYNWEREKQVFLGTVEQALSGKAAIATTVEAALAG